MEGKGKPGGLRRFSAVDIDQPVHGWKPVNGQFAEGMVNVRGWAALHVIVQKVADGESLKDLYDQIVLIENPGAVVVCTLGDKVGLVQNFRFTAERLFDAKGDYVRRLANEQRWEELLLSLGEWRWELPRGMAPPAEGDEGLEEYVVKTAKLESAGEAGFVVEKARICGRINPNSTFFAHSQYVVAAEILRRTAAQPEREEIVGGVKLFTMEELWALVARGELQDGLTLAALALSGFWK